jgi:putative endopeptidase
MSDYLMPDTKASALLRACSLITFAALAACSPPTDAPGGSTTTTRLDAPASTDSAPALGLGVDLANMDRSVRPQDDFFRYVNGGWLDRTTIPADRSRWGSFDELRDIADQHVLDIVLEATRSEAPADSDIRKIGDMYLSFMAEGDIEALGAQPLQEDLAVVDALSSHDDLATYWAGAGAHLRSAPFTYGVSQDQRQSDQYITTMGQSGLGMPDREYYLSDAERFVLLREQYLAHLTTMFQLADLADPAGAAARVLAVETRIAEAQWTRIENRDRNATYNRMSPAELSATAPGFDWLQFLDSAGLSGIDALVVRQPTYLSAITGFYRDIDMAHWRDYHRYHVVRSAAPYLSSAFVDAHFDFFGRTLSGQPEIRSRDKRAVNTVESVLGFAVGREYVDRHFQAEARERMDALVQNLMAAFEDAINDLEWMTEETKVEAQNKLSRFNVKIAYPNEWRDYSCLEVNAADLLGNVRRASQCEFERIMARLGQEVDREEWSMTPQTVNAYYSSTMNEIVFPAAILQPPFFDVTADDALNYGAIGAVIGHEITHGFDDQGRRSDGDGNLRDWWAEEDERQFRERADMMVQQFDDYEPIEGMNIQGALALGENIADLGGLAVSYRAWQRSLKGEPSAVIDGFTGDQRFFMGWGQIWRVAFREEALRQQLVTGPHAPGMYRVLGPLSNMPEFYHAFDVREGDGMYRDPAVRVKIW